MKRSSPGADHGDGGEGLVDSDDAVAFVKGVNRTV